MEIKSVIYKNDKGQYITIAFQKTSAIYRVKRLLKLINSVIDQELKKVCDG